VKFEDGTGFGIQQGEGAAHAAGEVPGDREPEASAARPLADRLAGPLEGIEYAVPGGGGDAGSEVGDPHHKSVVGEAAFDLETAAGCGVFFDVGDEVADDLAVGCPAAAVRMILFLFQD